MADIFQLSGSYVVNPAVGAPSGLGGIETPLSECVVLDQKVLRDYVLTSDAPVDVDFGNVPSAHVLIVKSVGGKVRVRITTADGATQAVPVDSLLILLSLSVPFTAVDLMRVVGTRTIVQVFLGERA